MTALSELTFSARLRDMTRADHTAAETSEFITGLMDGSRSARDYTLLLAQYRYIYGALEQECRRLSGDPELADILDSRLERSALLESDLSALMVQVGLGELPAQLPATAAYVQRIRESAQNPARILGHHYLRYLGDLSGGQIIGRLVARHYGIDESHLTMWRFEGIDKHKPYKDEYRDKLDGYATSAERSDAMIEESVRGFQLNRDLFAALLAQSAEMDSQQA
jgi:heme oxygenase